MLHFPAESAYEADRGQQEIHAYRDLDLRHDRIVRRAQKGFGLQVLLDPFEEQLDLPAFLVDSSNRAGSQMRGVGEKYVMLTGFWVSVADAAQQAFFLLPGHEVNAFAVQLGIPSVVGIAAIENNETAARQI